MTTQDLELFISCHRNIIPEMNIDQLCYLLRLTQDCIDKDPDYFHNPKKYANYRYCKILDLFRELPEEEKRGIIKSIMRQGA